MNDLVEKVCFIEQASKESDLDDFGDRLFEGARKKVNTDLSFCNVKEIS